MNYLKKHYSIIIVILMILFAIICGAYIYQVYDNSFNHHISPIPTKSDDSVATLRAEWGQLGDFFGGTLNPIFGFLSFVGLLLTLIIQIKSLEKSSEELELSRVELRNSAKALTAQNKAINLQSFEQTFFSWLTTYRSILSSIEYSGNNPQDTLNGRPLLNKWWQDSFGTRSLYMVIRNQKDSSPPNLPASVAYEAKMISDYRRHKQFILEIADDYRNEITQLILERWNVLYRNQEYQLDSLLRVLYRLILWIDSQNEESISTPQKWLYVSIIRSQLSWIEMAFLYANGLTEVGKKFKPFAEKYALFDNLTFDADASLHILKTYITSEKAYLPEAYNSEMARIKLGLPKSSEETLALGNGSPATQPFTPRRATQT